MSAPRQPAGPRAGSGRRTPGGARSASAARTAGRTTSLARPARRPNPGARAGRPPERAEVPPHAFEGLSGWQLLMAEFNAFLRDPTLTRLLLALPRRLAGAVRALAPAIGDAAAELARAVARLLRLAWLRSVLLGLLALLLPLALLSLLSSSDDERARERPAPAPAAAGAAAGPSLPGVAMPQLRELSAAPRPVRVALVVDGAYSPATLRRELRTLGTWLSANHAAGTRVSVIDARSGRASGRLRATELSRGLPARPRASTTAAVRSAFGRQEGRRLLVTAGAGTGSISRVRGVRRSRVAADARRPNALAASVARAIMTASGQRELR